MELTDLMAFVTFAAACFGAGYKVGFTVGRIMDKHKK